MASGLSGSTIKSWFQYRCERKTRYEIMDPKELAAVPIVKDQREQPWAMLGNDYEKRVVARLSRDVRVLKPGLDEESLSESQTIAFLRGQGSAAYAAQINLRPKGQPDFLGGADISLRRSFADLVRREIRSDGLHFTVIDIKATRVARAFHKTQVAFYVLLLKAYLKELSVDAIIETDGEIWCIPEDGDADSDRWTVESFSLAPYLRLVEDFCRSTLPLIASKVVSPVRDDTFFHVYFKCEQCAYLPHCINAVGPDRAPSVRDVSAVAGLSHEAKRTLLSIGASSVKGLVDLGEGVGKIDGAGWMLSRRAGQLVARAKALRDDKVLPGADPHTFLMPPRADVSIYLVADNDPVDDTLVTLGYRYVDDDGDRDHIEVISSSNRDAEANALVDVFSRLVADLERIDSHNAEIDDPNNSASKYAHIFFYEPSEALVLQEAVKRHLDDPRVRLGLLHMVRLFPPDDVVPEPEFRGMQHLPATALRSVVEQLFALPVTVSYDLRQVSGALHRAGSISNSYRPEPQFERPFSALLALDISRHLRAGRGLGPSKEEIWDDVSARLAASQAIAEWLRAEHLRRVNNGERPMLRLNKQPFRLQSSFNPLDAGDLDVLRAFELLENRAGLLDTMIRLAQPKQTRRDAGRAIGPMKLVRAKDKGKFTEFAFEMPRECENNDIGANTLGLILSDGEPESVLEPRLWQTLGCNLMPSWKGDRPTQLRLRMFTGNFKSHVFQDLMRRTDEQGWWLDQTFVDFNSSKADAFLTFLGAEVQN